MNAKNILLTASLCTGVGLAPLLAQTGKEQQQPTPKPSSSPMSMMGMNMGKMMSNWKEQDAELDKLVANMNSAPSDKKLDAIAAVVTKLVEQRKAMHERMEKMMTEGKSEMTDMGHMMMMMRMMMGEDQENQGKSEQSPHH